MFLVMELMVGISQFWCEPVLGSLPVKCGSQIFTAESAESAEF